MADETCKEKEYTFVQETIRPKKKSNGKKVLFTVSMAVTFGVVSGIVFCLCLPLFSEYFEVNNKQIIIGKGEEFGNISAMTISESTPAAKTTYAPTEEPRKTKEPEKDNDQEEILKSNGQIQKLCQKVNRSIVKVNNMNKSYDIFSEGKVDTVATSGVVVGKSEKYLFIYVNASRIDEKENIFVTFSNNTMVSATIYNKQEELGIIILAVERAKISEDTLASVELADFSLENTLKTGESVLALGSPNGHLYSLACGYISNEPYNAYMIDNSITLFNSTISCNGKGDGVLVDMSGKIIGFITHVPAFASGLNYEVNTCYSSVSLKPIITRLVNRSEQIYFGVKTSDITPEIAYSTGVQNGIFITSVENNSPAFYADLKKGDIITAIDEMGVANSAQFNSIINKYKVKEKTAVTFYRSEDGKQVKKKTTIELEAIR